MDASDSESEGAAQSQTRGDGLLDTERSHELLAADLDEGEQPWGTEAEGEAEEEQVEATGAEGVLGESLEYPPEDDAEAQTEHWGAEAEVEQTEAPEAEGGAAPVTETPKTTKSKRGRKDRSQASSTPASVNPTSERLQIDVNVRVVDSAGDTVHELEAEDNRSGGFFDCEDMGDATSESEFTAMQEALEMLEEHMGEDAYPLCSAPSDSGSSNASSVGESDPGDRGRDTASS